MAQPFDPVDPDNPENPGGNGGGGGTGGGGVPGTAIFSLTFNKHEASSVPEIIAYANVYSNDDLVFAAYLAIDGAVYQQSSVNLILDNVASKASVPVCLPQYISGISAGNHTVVFSIRNREPDSPLSVLAGSTIKVSELKQGSV